MLTVTVRDRDTLYIASPLDLAPGLDEGEALCEDNLSVWLASEGEGCYLTCGCPNSFFADLLRYHPLGLTGKVTLESMISQVLPATRALCEEYGQICGEDEDELLTDFTLAKEEAAFRVTSHMEVEELAEDAAYGRRDKAATAALLENGTLPPLERIRAAFTAAALDDPSISYFPVVAVNVKTGKRVLLRDKP